jgi:hypothetical protein
MRAELPTSATGFVIVAGVIALPDYLRGNTRVMLSSSHEPAHAPVDTSARPFSYAAPANRNAIKTFARENQNKSSKFFSVASEDIIDRYCCT